MLFCYQNNGTSLKIGLCGVHVRDECTFSPGIVAEQSGVTLSPPNKLSYAKLILCFNFQSASMWLKIGENVV